MKFGAKLFISILGKASNIVCNCLTIIYTVKNDEEKEKIGKALFSLLGVSSILLLGTIIVKTRKYLLVKKALKLAQELKLEALIKHELNNFLNFITNLVSHNINVTDYKLRINRAAVEAQNQNQIMLFQEEFIQYLGNIEEFKLMLLLNNFTTTNSMKYNLKKLGESKRQVLISKNDVITISVALQSIKSNLENLERRLTELENQT
ncbi:uncharacterized protein RJT21DRAFT_3466 [Scheffersomyces amazonensis]|uniref:uncharacterized protein n=1 Tax=Scheffersomyces amazonensis TaxID=1078765 RepID=UPI00315CDBED